MTDNSRGEVILYEADAGARVEMRAIDGTVWLTQAQIAELYGSSVQNVQQTIARILDDGELDEGTINSELIVRQEGARQVRREVQLYNLEMVLAVGYRSTSIRALRFRQWATSVLRDYLVKGFAMDDAKLKNLGGGTYWRELLERIRDIRSSEKVLHRQILDLYATSVDYDKASPVNAEFFAVVQNKLHFAAHGRTAAEVIAARADADLPNMGHTSFVGERPRKSDVTVAKNYLAEGELRKLNTLVSAYFDAAEFRAQNHEATHMKDWLAHLDRLIVAMDAGVLDSAGTVSGKTAKALAEGEYEKFRAKLDAVPSDVENAYFETIKGAQRAIEGKS